jgi:hypothetical protein
VLLSLTGSGFPFLPSHPISTLSSASLMNVRLTVLVWTAASVPLSDSASARLLVCVPRMSFHGLPVVQQTFLATLLVLLVSPLPPKGSDGLW